MNTRNVRNIMIKLSDIKALDEIQSREKINHKIIKEYAAAIKRGNKFPAILVFEEANNKGTYILSDGFHRYYAHKENNLDEILARVEVGDQNDALFCSLFSNKNHGLRRNIRDKRKSVEIILKDKIWGQWSDRQIAKKCGVSNKFVSKLRKEIAFDNNTQMERSIWVSRNGINYKMNLKSNKKEASINKESSVYIDSNEIIIEREAVAKEIIKKKEELFILIDKLEKLDNKEIISKMTKESFLDTLEKSLHKCESKSKLVLSFLS